MRVSRYILALLLPPVGVYLAYGLSVTLFINIALTVLGWIPGMIHAVWAISKFEERTVERY
jgi:uncharacterized membrane protein YqaE (UPF0057 family)